MKPAHAILFVLALPVLAPGCARIKARFAPPDGYVEPERPNDSCDSLTYRKYVGQDAAALYDVVFVDPVRYLTPDTPVAEDYDQTRINFDIDASGTVTRVWCG